MFDEVAKLLHALDEGMIPISVFSPYLPIPAHFRRDKCVACVKYGLPRQACVPALPLSCAAFFLIPMHAPL